MTNRLFYFTPTCRLRGSSPLDHSLACAHALPCAISYLGGATTFHLHTSFILTHLPQQQQPLQKERNLKEKSIKKEPAFNFLIPLHP